MNELSTVSTTNLIMQPEAFDRMMNLAETMSAGTVMVPKHLHGKPADCAAIVMQALQWGMNPYAVAQKTHLVNGVLGYEAQLVNAVAQSSGAISGRFHYEYKGDGDNTECRVGAVLSGESEITWGEWLNANKVKTKNSPLWQTNLKQQLGYLQLKNWCRVFCPQSILGVYTVDELEVVDQEEKDITPKASQEPAQPKALPEMPNEKFKQNFEAYEKGIMSGRKKAEDVIATLSSAYALTEDQINAIKSIKAPIEGEAETVQ